MPLERTKTPLKMDFALFLKNTFLAQKRREFLQKNTAIIFVFFVENLVHVQHIESRLDWAMRHN